MHYASNCSSHHSYTRPYPWILSLSRWTRLIICIRFCVRSKHCSTVHKKIWCFAGFERMTTVRVGRSRSLMRQRDTRKKQSQNVIEAITVMQHRYPINLLLVSKHRKKSWCYKSIKFSNAEKNRFLIPDPLLLDLFNVAEMTYFISSWT